MPDIFYASVVLRPVAGGWVDGWQTCVRFGAVRCAGPEIFPHKSGGLDFVTKFLSARYFTGLSPTPQPPPPLNPFSGARRALSGAACARAVPEWTMFRSGNVCRDGNNFMSVCGHTADTDESNIDDAHCKIIHILSPAPKPAPPLPKRRSTIPRNSAHSCFASFPPRQNLSSLRPALLSEGDDVDDDNDLMRRARARDNLPPRVATV